MSQLTNVPVGDNQQPRGRDRLAELVILAATLLGALAITDGDVPSAIFAVTSLRGVVR